MGSILKASYLYEKYAELKAFKQYIWLRKELTCDPWTTVRSTLSTKLTSPLISNVLSCSQQLHHISVSIWGWLPWNLKTRHTFGDCLVLNDDDDQCQWSDWSDMIGKILIQLFIIHVCEQMLRWEGGELFLHDYSCHYYSWFIHVITIHDLPIYGKINE